MVRLLFAALVLLPSSKALAGEWDEIRQVEIRPVEDTLFATPVYDNECDGSQAKAWPSSEIGWDEIINIGKEFWQIIEANKPVVHVELPVAHAMPRGLNCWSELESWQIPRTQSYEVIYKNGFGIKVVTFRFRLQFTYGGSHAGRGRYLANVSVLASQLDVVWGYTFNANVDVARAVNLGSSHDPLAGLEMNLHWNVKTVLKESENSVHFFVSGNGDVQFAQ
ncbi:MAG: hypothetical protein AB7F86_10365 [Bdellovibrionales bacterium]